MGWRKRERQSEKKIAADLCVPRTHFKPWLKDSRLDKNILFSYKSYQSKVIKYPRNHQVVLRLRVHLDYWKCLNHVMSDT